MSPAQVFVCAADADSLARDALEKTLQPLVRQSVLTVWHMGRIPAGANIKDELNRYVAHSLVFVVLISADLIATHAELIEQIMLQKSRGAKVLPIQLRPALLAGTGLEELKALSVKNEDDWIECAEAIRRAVEAPLPILFLAANPNDADRTLRLGEELTAIATELQQAKHGVRFALQHAPGGQLADLYQAVLRHKPLIVHLGGHGTPSKEIVFLAENGGGVPVPVQAVVDFFAILSGHNLRGVVFTNCFSDETARGVAQHIDWTIGVAGEIKDASVIKFSRAFYSALSEGESVETAFELGKTTLVLSSLPHADRLRLYLAPPGMARSTSADPLPPVVEAKMVSRLFGEVAAIALQPKARPFAILGLFNRRSVAAVSALAAAVALTITMYAPPVYYPLPAYVLAISGDREMLGARNAEGRLTMDSVLCLELRPAEPVSGPIRVKAFLRVAGKLQPWPISLNRLPRGSFSFKVPIRDLPDLLPGKNTLIFVLGRMEDEISDEQVASFLDKGTGRAASFQILQHDILVVP